METLKEIKKALEEVPDELLDKLHFGTGEGAEGEIRMVAQEGEGQYDFPQVFDLIEEKYPNLMKIDKLILNIGKASHILSVGDIEAEKMDEKLCDEEAVLDTFFDKK